MSLKEILGLTPKRFEEWLRLATKKEKDKVLREAYKEARR